MTFADALLADLPWVAILYSVALLLWLATLPVWARWRRRGSGKEEQLNG